MVPAHGREHAALMHPAAVSPHSLRPADNELYDRGCDLVEAAAAIRQLAGEPRAARAVPAVIGCLEAALAELSGACGRDGRYDGAGSRDVDARRGRAAHAARLLQPPARAPRRQERGNGRSPPGGEIARRLRCRWRGSAGLTQWSRRSPLATLDWTHTRPTKGEGRS